jgi:hypothetical protein
MSIERRCNSKEDFISMFNQNTRMRNPLKYRSKEESALKVWNDLIKNEEKFYKKYGYLDVIYDSGTNKYYRKKVRGRPQACSTKENRITVRLSDDQLQALEDYCLTNNINDKSEVIREAIMSFIKL